MGVKRNLFGLFGGSFDPVHKGHLKVALTSIKTLKLNKLYWSVTKQNPLKNKTHFSLKDRIQKSKKIVKNNKKIKIQFLENKAKSSSTVDVLSYLIKKNKSSNFYLIVGSDNLLDFHKWKKWKKILKMCKLVVFSRKGFDLKSKKSVIVRHLSKNKILYIKNSKVDISSSKIRKNYLR